MVSITIEGSPFLISVPPFAMVRAWWRRGLIALIFHPVLLILSPLQAPSDCMMRLGRLSKTKVWFGMTSMYCSSMLLLRMWLHTLSASVLCSLLVHVIMSSFFFVPILPSLNHWCILLCILLNMGSSLVSVFLECPQIISWRVWLSTLICMQPMSWCQLVSCRPSLML